MRIENHYVNPVHISYVIRDNNVVEINFPAKYLRLEMETEDVAKELFHFIRYKTKWWGFLLREKF